MEMGKLLQVDKLQLIDANIGEGYSLYLFKPKIMSLFPKSGNMHTMDLKQKIRFLLLMIHGYRVYVLGDADNNAVGCAVFANGGTYRYPFANGNDLICGPYFIMPEYRGRGIATRMLDYIIKNHETRYETIYAHIWYENQASIVCMSKLGFEVLERLRTTKITQRCVFDKNGKLILVKKDNSVKMR